MHDKHKTDPKSRQRHKANRDKETMGGSRSRSPSPKHQTVNPETFWSSLVLNWHSYSRKKKFGLIIVGLVACGLTLYLATLLASSMYVQLSTQLDKEGPLQKNYPEFRKGTKAYSPQDAAAMEKGYQKTQAALRPILEKSRTAKVVIGVGEAHDASFSQKINILNVVKQHQEENPDIPVTIITEIPQGNVKAAKETLRFLTHSVDKLNDPNLSRLKPATYKEQAEKFFSSLPKHFPDRRQQLGVMSIVATHVYGFDQVVSEGHPTLTATQQQTMVAHSNAFGGIHIILSKSPDHKKVEVISDHPLSHYVLQQIDRALTLTTRSALKAFKKKGIVITFLGTAHLRAYSESLEKMGTPHELLHLQHPHKHTEDFIPLLDYCFLPFDRCPQPLQEETLKTGKLIQYCGVTKSDPAAKNCDPYLDEKVAYLGKGSQFYLNLKNQIPETLPKRSPKTITDFFTTEKAIAEEKQPSAFEQVKDFAKRVDEALSFPTANAARTPPKLFELYPEFTQGNDDHEEDIEKEMEKGFRAIDDALYPFLQKPTQKSKVIAVLETHIESFIFKNLLFAYLRAFSDHTQAKITVVHEFIMSPTMRKKLFEFYLDMLAFHNPEKTHTRKSVESHFKTNCFDRDYSTVPAQKSALILCTLQAAGAYNFNFVPADANLIDPASEGSTYRIYSLRTKNTYNFPLASVSTIDESLALTIRQQLSRSRHTDIILYVMGAAHGKVISAVLETSDHPHLMLHTQNPASDFWAQQLPLFKKFLRACIIKMEHCPPAIHKSAKAQNIAYCADGKYGPNKNCDEKFHNIIVDVSERRDFATSSSVVQLPPILPERNPKKLTDFFAPKSSMKMLEAKLAQDKKESENKDNSRMEL